MLKGKGDRGPCRTPLQFVFTRSYVDAAGSLAARYRAASMASPPRGGILFRRDLVGHFGCVNAIEFSNDGGEWIASGGDDRRVLLWNTARALGSGGSPAVMGGQHNSNIFCLAFDSSNTKIFSGGNDEQVIVHDIQSKQPLDVFQHKDAIYGVTVDPINDNVFASACDDGRILIYDIRLSPGDDPFVLANYVSPMHTVVYNPVDSRLLATANATEGVALWDIRKPRTCLLRYDGALSAQSAMSVRFDQRGDRLLALRRRLPPVLYALHAPAPLVQFEHDGYHNSCTMKSCCFAGDADQYVLSGSDDFNLYMWKIPELPSKSGFDRGAHLVLRGHRSIVNQVRYNPDNALIISSGVEKVIKAWSPFNIESPRLRSTPGDASDADDAPGAALLPARPLLTRDDYVDLVLGSPGAGELISHDYTHQSTAEDPRMIAFFDSLVRRDLDGGGSTDGGGGGAVFWTDEEDGEGEEGGVLSGLSAGGMGGSFEVSDTSTDLSLSYAGGGVLAGSEGGREASGGVGGERGAAEEGGGAESETDGAAVGGCEGKSNDVSTVDETGVGFESVMWLSTVASRARDEHEIGDKREREASNKYEIVDNAKRENGVELNSGVPGHHCHGDIAYGVLARNDNAGHCAYMSRVCIGAEREVAGTPDPILLSAQNAVGVEGGATNPSLRSERNAVGPSGIEGTGATNLSLFREHNTVRLLLVEQATHKVVGSKTNHMAIQPGSPVSLASSLDSDTRPQRPSTSEAARQRASALRRVSEEAQSVLRDGAAVSGVTAERLERRLQLRRRAEARRRQARRAGRLMALGRAVGGMRGRGGTLCSSSSSSDCDVLNDDSSSGADTVVDIVTQSEMTQNGGHVADISSQPFDVEEIDPSGSRLPIEGWSGDHRAFNVAYQSLLDNLVPPGTTNSRVGVSTLPSADGGGVEEWREGEGRGDGVGRREGEERRRQSLGRLKRLRALAMNDDSDKEVLGCVKRGLYGPPDAPEAVRGAYEPPDPSYCPPNLNLLPGVPLCGIPGSSNHHVTQRDSVIEGLMTGDDFDQTTRGSMGTSL